MSNFNIGDIVQVPYKSGSYVGELVEERQDKYLIKVIAVLKHPMQGDLHHPKQVENVIFHERKALAQYEKVYVLKEIVQPYQDELIDYSTSLKEAVKIYREQLEAKESAYNKEALRALKSVEENYYLKHYY
ncbi:sporulation phosphorelay system protein KapB [Ornithinibacillus halotolerans]|uniref:Kinase-associated lipoprotein B n=1 Tax=Ornithinibacillus halotolerans TaxID=1274357 RepID=A0A916RYH2_9BACI|nr:sporulation phosphorelay system protein KapB [Ornithinibacillus halotolerans]GGA76586.1 kinase-associated lipoprotein B [Ornithinibacillus halotolerans]